jgi:hypothetical protein
MSWQLYDEATSEEKNSGIAGNSKFAVYRCVDPVAIKTSKPWYTITNVCPCDPKLSNTTGRGFTSCPFGVSKPIEGDLVGTSGVSLTGSLFGSGQVVPPQLQPRELYRIGVEWRS